MPNAESLESVCERGEAQFDKQCVERVSRESIDGRLAVHIEIVEMHSWIPGDISFLSLRSSGRLGPLIFKFGYRLRGHIGLGAYYHYMIIENGVQHSGSYNSPLSAAYTCSRSRAYHDRKIRPRNGVALLTLIFETRMLVLVYLHAGWCLQFNHRLLAFRRFVV